MFNPVRLHLYPNNAAKKQEFKSETKNRLFEDNKGMNKKENLSFTADKTVRLTQTLLRDGNQSLRRPLSFKEKDKLYRLLAKDGYGTIEVGFPTANDREFEACQHLAGLSRDDKINPFNAATMALTRAIKKDIESTWNAIKHGCKPMIQIAYGVNEDQVRNVYRTTYEEMGRRTLEIVKFAAGLTKSVPGARIRVGFEHFFDVKPAQMDSTLNIMGEFVKAGAGNITLANTVERTTPKHVAQMTKETVARMHSIDRSVIIGIHPHNDKGRAVDTALHSVEAGVKDVDVSTYGLGERQGGNLNAEQFIKVLEDDYGYRTGIQRDTMYHAGETLLRMRPDGIMLKSPNETYSGMHINGVSKVPYLYSPVPQKLLKLSEGRKEKIFTSQSGGTKLWQILEEQGHQTPQDKAEVKRIAYAMSNYAADVESQGQTCPSDKVIAHYYELLKR